jgi:class 3 adenylate cyclase/tetratricopeptide (TPR) repeat protein
MDVGAWLRGLGLERYEAAFRENEITEKVLPNLTSDDLKDLGVTIVGHRRTLLDAIAALRTDKSTDAAPLHSITDTPVKDTAERRQVTVLFSDLVGSTALSARMDPEDLRDLIAAYQKCVAEAVRRYEGFVAKYLGDGALVYFGYPQAHEDDAERAVRAGLDLIAAVSVLKSPVPLQTRVGVATGLVVVGDLIKSDDALERGIVGETPNLAARLQSIAEPNAVVIAESTRRLLGGLFELQDLGARDLRGISGPTRAWAALRPSPVESRFEALHESGLTELVGRDEEIELLLRRWSRAKGGEGQVVLISGEPGIGKSRLTAALMERLADEPHTRLRYFCSPQHTDSALYPIIGQMERAALLAHNDTATAKLDKLDALLGQTSTPAQDAALFAAMLSLANDGRYPTLDLDPQQRRQKTLQALISQLESLSRQHPVLMILEDAHWTDPTTLEAFGRVVDRLRTFRLLLIVTFRPEFQPPWIGRPYVTALIINRLGAREVGDIVDRLVGNRELVQSIRADIIERTDGIPLFVEEMTKAVLEAETDDEARRTAAGVPSPAVAVPASLHASLMARLDRLGPAKGVAQVGGTIGRQFSHALLAAVAGKPDAELNSALERLIAAGLVFRQGAPPYATYLFKHALVQDAAYGTLLREARRSLHARIVQVLEVQFADIAESQPELLARHCTEAGLIEKAAGLWGKAGQRSLARSALVEAAEQLARALAGIATLSGTPAVRREQIKHQVALANALMYTKGYAAPETRAALDQARSFIDAAVALGEPPEDSLPLLSVLYGFWIANIVAFNGDVVRELAAQLLDVAEKQKAPGPLVIGHRVMGMSLLYTGNFPESRTHLDRAITLYQPVEHRPLAIRFGQDIQVAAVCSRSLTLWLLGYPDAALRDSGGALRTAREIGQAQTLMCALLWRSWSHVWCGDYVAACTLLDELLALANEKSAPFWKGRGITCRGCVLALTGRALSAIQMINSGLALLKLTGTTQWIPLHLSRLAMAHAELGQIHEASRCIDEAMQAAEATRLSFLLSGTQSFDPTGIFAEAGRFTGYRLRV